MVDLTRAEDGLLRARLLDLRPGRSGTVYRTWLEEQTEASGPASPGRRSTRSAGCQGRSGSRAVIQAVRASRCDARPGPPFRWPLRVPASRSTGSATCSAMAPSI